MLRIAIDIIAGIVAMALLVVAMVLDSPTPAYPHDAPSGWSYPFTCCSGYDCRHVHTGAVRAGADGYVVPSGEVVGYADDRIRPSPDGEYHWCSVAGKDDGRTLCLFVPPMGF